MNPFFKIKSFFFPFWQTHILQNCLHLTCEWPALGIRSTFRVECTVKTISGLELKQPHCDSIFLIFHFIRWLKLLKIYTVCLLNHLYYQLYQFYVKIKKTSRHWLPYNKCYNTSTFDFACDSGGKNSDLSI